MKSFPFGHFYFLGGHVTHTGPIRAQILTACYFQPSAMFGSSCTVF